MNARAKRLAAVACSRWGFAAASFLFFCFYAANVQWQTVAWDSIFSRGPNAETLAEARRLDLSYEAALADPKGSVGKPVVWYVDHPRPGYAFAGGKPSQPLLLANDDGAPVTRPTERARMLAVVTAVENGVVAVRFLERR